MFHKKKTVSIGIDMSEKALKGVLLEKQASGFSIASYTHCDIPIGVMSKQGIGDAKQLGDIMERAVRELQNGHLSHTIVSIALPEPETFLTTLTIHTSLPDHSEKTLTPLIQEEIKQHIPLDPEHLVMDWQIIEHTATSATVVVAAAPHDLVNTFTSLFASQRVIPCAFEIESIAIARAIIPLQTSLKNTMIIVDIGARRSGLSLAHGTTVHAAVSAPISSTSIIEAISTTTKISTQEAEKLLFSFGISPHLQAPKPYQRIVISAVHDLITRIQDVIQFSQAHLHQPPAQSILLTGGGARIQGIAPYLAKELGIVTQEADPLANITHSLSHPCPIPPHERHHFTTAIGLALRNSL